MSAEPPKKPVAVVFVDGQNLFHSAKEAFGYRWPNYDVMKLAGLVCSRQGWTLRQVRFYTGVPDARDDWFWNQFWSRKLLEMSRHAVTYSRSLRYRNQIVRLPDGKEITFPVAQEKGIDIRIALDVVRLALDRHYDVAVIFSQDQDITEAVEEVKEIAQMQERWVRMACAFPTSPTYRNRRGIDKTDWLPITRADYEACIDPRDYRPKRR